MFLYLLFVVASAQGQEGSGLGDASSTANPLDAFFQAVDEKVNEVIPEAVDEITPLVNFVPESPAIFATSERPTQPTSTRQPFRSFDQDQLLVPTYRRNLPGDVDEKVGCIMFLW